MGFPYKQKIFRTYKVHKVKNRRKAVWNSVNTSHLANMYIVQCSPISSKHTNLHLYPHVYTYPYTLAPRHDKSSSYMASPNKYWTRRFCTLNKYKPRKSVHTESELIGHESPRGLLVCRAQIFEISKGNLYICSPFVYINIL